MQTMFRRALKNYNDLRHQLDNNLIGEEGDLWKAELVKFLRKEPSWSNGRVAQVTQPKTKPSIFEFVSTVVVASTTRKFVAKDKFVVNTKRSAPVKIRLLGVNFIKWFLSGNGKIEDPISEPCGLRYARLRQPYTDRRIIKELGGKAKAETTLTEMFSLMKKRKNRKKNGKVGILLDNGWTNIFYIKDQNGVLRAVFVFWCDDGWYVCASSVESPHGWHGGHRVFSRNSVLESSEPSAPAA